MRSNSRRKSASVAAGTSGRCVRTAFSMPGRTTRLYRLAHPGRQNRARTRARTGLVPPPGLSGEGCCWARTAAGKQFAAASAAARTRMRRRGMCPPDVAGQASMSPLWCNGRAVTPADGRCDRLPAAVRCRRRYRFARWTARRGRAAPGSHAGCCCAPAGASRRNGASVRGRALRQAKRAAQPRHCQLDNAWRERTAFGADEQRTVGRKLIRQSARGSAASSATLASTGTMRALLPLPVTVMTSPRPGAGMLLRLRPSASEMRSPEPYSKASTAASRARIRGSRSSPARKSVSAMRLAAVIARGFGSVFAIFGVRTGRRGRPPCPCRCAQKARERAHAREHAHQRASADAIGAARGQKGAHVERRKPRQRGQRHPALQMAGEEAEELAKVVLVGLHRFGDMRRSGRGTRASARLRVRHRGPRG